MRPTTTALAALIPAIALGGFLLHWLWNSWIVQFGVPPLPWPQAFVLALLLSKSGSFYLGQIADLLHERWK